MKFFVWSGWQREFSRALQQTAYLLCGMSFMAVNLEGGHDTDFTKTHQSIISKPGITSGAGGLNADY